jgi:hypothetical protein
MFWRVILGGNQENQTASFIKVECRRLLLYNTYKGIVRKLSKGKWTVL